MLFERAHIITTREHMLWIVGLAGAIALAAVLAMIGCRRRVRQQSLREAEQRLAGALGLSGVAAWNWNPKKDLVVWSGPVWEIFGRAESELSSFAAFQKILPTEDLELLRQKIEDSMKTGADYEAEFRILLPGGQIRWIAGLGGVSFKSGEIGEMSGVNFDVTEKKLAEKEIKVLNESLERRVEERTAALAKSEERFRCLIDGVKDYAILMLDVTGNVYSWNSGAERITGYTAEEIVGKHFSVFYTEEDRAALYPERELSIAEQAGRFEEEGWRVDKHGSKFWASVVVTALRAEDGTLRGFSKVTRDITERKRSEELVSQRNTELAQANVELSRQTQRAEEASRAKSDFLAAMSHEVRTPMNAILGMADLLWETELDPTQRQYVGVFRRAGANLLTLVNDILDLSKIESGHFELEQIDFDLEDLAERTIEIIRPKAQAKHIALIAHVMPGTPLQLVGDPTRLQQVLLNLLGNAVKFTGQGEVALRIAFGGPEPGRIHFEVADTGIGIAADKLGRVFDDFTQAEASTTRRFGGTGLGLGISRRLVSRMGGDLQATSEVGKGSRFYFDALFTECTAPKLQRLSMTDGIVGRRVLIVDNNATNRLIFAEMCSAWGMQVSECGRAADVLAVLEAAIAAHQPFDVLLLDRVMPGMDGFELLSPIRNLQPLLPVILATSDNLPGDETRSKQLGLAGYMVKPVRRSELLRIVCNALGTSSAVTPNDTDGPVADQITAMPGRHGSILIAEDSDDNRFLLQAYLKNARYDITFVENGERAVESASAKAFDLILMDMQMPVMDGLTATSLIRRREKESGHAPTPIVALTANARAEDIEACKQGGCTSHLAKPIAKQKLLAAIEEYMAKSKKPGAAQIVVDVPPGLEEAAKRYIQSRKDEVPALVRMAAECRFSELSTLAHNIKGAGTSYGFPDLTELGGLIEVSAKRQNIGALSQQLADLARYVEQAADVVGAIAT